MKGQCVVCGSSAIKERRRRPEGPGILLCAAHVAVCNEHLKDPCPQCDGGEVQYEDCQGYQGGCGSPSCLTCNPETEKEN